jgi:ATP-dependent Clp protease adaptor protein ClpS
MANKEKDLVDDLLVADTDESKSLIVHNDDHNFFDFVVEALIQVCDHTEEQALQCTLIIHNKGKCDVKQGSYNELNPMREGLTQRGINATID